MENKDFRKHIVGLFIAGVIFTFLSFISFWNARLETELPGIWPLLFSMISVSAFGYLFYIALQATDKKKLQEILDKKVAEEKTKLFEELNKEEKVEVDHTEEEEIEQVQKWIPSGTFKKVDSFGKKMLSNLANELNCVQAILYKAAGDQETFEFITGYGLTKEEPVPNFSKGEGLNGETANGGEIMVVSDIPENYFIVESGLGKAKVGNLILVPLVYNNSTIGLIELASFNPISEKNLNMLKKYADFASKKLYQLTNA